MRKIAIVTDSSAGIPPELAKKLNVEIVPIGVQINQQFYREGIDLSANQLYSQFDSAQNISTSQPSPGDFLQVYERIAQRAQEIISIHVTSLGSGTVNAANLAKTQTSIPITVVDSKTASMAQGFITLAAAQAAINGCKRAEILNIINKVRQESAIFVAVPTLKYLARSGRVSSAKSLLASLLSIKPILGVQDGEVKVIDKIRSYPKALQRLLTLVEERFPQKELQIAILHSNAYQEARDLQAKVEERIKYSKIFLAELGASLAVHGGQGMLGIAAYSGADLQI